MGRSHPLTGRSGRAGRPAGKRSLPCAREHHTAAVPRRLLRPWRGGRGAASPLQGGQCIPERAPTHHDRRCRRHPRRGPAVPEPSARPGRPSRPSAFTSVPFRSRRARSRRCVAAPPARRARQRLAPTQGGRNVRGRTFARHGRWYRPHRIRVSCCLPLGPSDRPAVTAHAPPCHGDRRHCSRLLERSPAPSDLRTTHGVAPPAERRRSAASEPIPCRRHGAGRARHHVPSVEVRQCRRSTRQAGEVRRRWTARPVCSIRSHSAVPRRCRRTRPSEVLYRATDPNTRWRRPVESVPEEDARWDARSPSDGSRGCARSWPADNPI
jgi:hypothetical protein